ncbi:PAS sensor-containing signal transduction protein [Campylobacter blaseri]|uniref:Histidine kinase n=1 Tax=Campylobacter blaseri TaxID=2042961 RepID=A0A2P8R1Z9_9BACT|nr:PAS domain-containing protein [Campylobacter blaseri]PSM52521.1 histidine kinase [Campylobacter blaseri]PSM54169.1 histidine kinase [Campylobacter blaseri]QKF85819.1 PAS sensor-containing signal transduction protein [Campylobacter blaseri]
MKRPEPINKEIKLTPNRYIVSKTDPKGIITYANDYFVEIVQYTRDELIGQPHNIIRHPDMPKIAFKLMWDTIQQGKNFKALVKNLAKDGRFYWVITDFENLYDPTRNRIVSYTAYRMAPPRSAIKTMEPIYKKLVELEKTGGMEASGKFLEEFLKENNTTYDDFIESLVTPKGNFLARIIDKIKSIFKK